MVVLPTPPFWLATAMMRGSSYGLDLVLGSSSASSAAASVGRRPRHPAARPTVADDPVGGVRSVGRHRVLGRVERDRSGPPSALGAGVVVSGTSGPGSGLGPRPPAAATGRRRARSRRRRRRRRRRPPDRRPPAVPVADRLRQACPPRHRVRFLREFRRPAGCRGIRDRRRGRFVHFGLRGMLVPASPTEQASSAALWIDGIHATPSARSAPGDVPRETSQPPGPDVPRGTSRPERALQGKVASAGELVLQRRVLAEDNERGDRLHDLGRHFETDPAQTLDGPPIGGTARAVRSRSARRRRRRSRSRTPPSPGAGRSPAPPRVGTTPGAPGRGPDPRRDPRSPRPGRRAPAGRPRCGARPSAGADRRAGRRVRPATRSARTSPGTPAPLPRSRNGAGSRVDAHARLWAMWRSTGSGPSRPIRRASSRTASSGSGLTPDQDGRITT